MVTCTNFVSRESICISISSHASHMHVNDSFIYCNTETGISIIFFLPFNNTCKEWMLQYKRKIYCRSYMKFIIKLQVEALHLLKTNSSFLLENLYFTCIKMSKPARTTRLKGWCNNCTCNRVEIWVNFRAIRVTSGK